MALDVNHQFSGTPGAAFTGDAVFGSPLTGSMTYATTAGGQVGIRCAAGVFSVTAHTFTGTTGRLIHDFVVEMGGTSSAATEWFQNRAAAKSTAGVVNGSGIIGYQNAAGTTDIGPVGLPGGGTFRVNVDRDGTTTTCTIWDGYTAGSAVWDTLTATQAADSLTSVRLGWSNVNQANPVTYSWYQRGTNPADFGFRSYGPPPLTFAAVTATGWTPTGGTATQVLGDASDATYLTSPNNPSSSVVDLTLRPIVPPAGDFVVTFRGSQTVGTTNTVAVTLRDGGSTVATATISGSLPVSTTGDISATFSAASIAGVTQSKWAAGTLVVRAAVTAS